MARYPFLEIFTVVMYRCHGNPVFNIFCKSRDLITSSLLPVVGDVIVGQIAPVLCQAFKSSPRFPVFVNGHMLFHCVYITELLFCCHFPLSVFPSSTIMCVVFFPFTVGVCVHMQKYMSRIICKVCYICACYFSRNYHFEYFTSNL